MGKRGCKIFLCEGSTTGKNIYCSVHLRRWLRSGRLHLLTPKERLESGIEKSSEGCWEMIKGISTNGYSHIEIKGKSVLSHRLSYEFYVGKIPIGLLVLHKCDNRKCVNPSHLFLGTHKDNTQDMIKKGRREFGQKLTLEKVEKIRLLRRDQSLSIGSLAQMFNVTKTNIYKILNNTIWVGGKNHVVS